MVSITSEPPQPEPGATALLTLHISRTNGNVGGFYLITNGKGVLADVAGQSTRKITADEMVHSAPKAATGNEILFQMRWTAPATKGGADLDVWAVSANGDGRSGGDAESHARFNVGVGCAGLNVYVDTDGDGFGVTDPLGLTRVCELGPGFATKGGDCNDNDKDVFPGHAEVCNLKDDNCDGKVNEGLGLATLYKDLDGDGYGDTKSEVRMNCSEGFGYVSRGEDCNDNDPNVHPGVMEICNNIDDDCNGKIDDGAKAYCGTGWCRRVATTCDPKTCVVGMPRAEECNAFDDDCDGVIDNGPNICGAGKACLAGRCLTADDAAALAAAAAAAADAGAGNADGGVGNTGGGPVVDGGVPTGPKGKLDAPVTGGDDPAPVGRPRSTSSGGCFIAYMGLGQARPLSGPNSVPMLVIVGATLVLLRGGKRLRASGCRGPHGR